MYYLSYILLGCLGMLIILVYGDWNMIVVKIIEKVDVCEICCKLGFN